MLISIGIGYVDVLVMRYNYVDGTTIVLLNMLTKANDSLVPCFLIDPFASLIWLPMIMDAAHLALPPLPRLIKHHQELCSWNGCIRVRSFQAFKKNYILR